MIYTSDVVGSCMAGPGIRAYELARQLRHVSSVTLVAKLIDEEALDLCGIVPSQVGSKEGLEAIDGADVVVGQPSRATLRAARSDRRVIFDLFDPVVLELDQMKGGLRRRMHRQIEANRLSAALRLGHRLIVATPAQLELYREIGRRAGVRDVEARSMVVPFGVPESEPHEAPKRRPPLVVWNGGVWPWLDPETAIRAVGELNRSGLEVTLGFMGTARPNPAVAAALPDLPALSKEPWLEWNRTWVSYLERSAALTAASIALVLHGDTPEARYSIRTRLFDAIWCGVPMIATRGGFASDLIEGEGLGIVVEPGDVRGVALAIRTLLEDDARRASAVAALAGVRERFRWSEVCKPLRDELVRMADENDEK